jgi:hypothetical protein
MLYSDDQDEFDQDLESEKNLVIIYEDGSMQTLDREGADDIYYAYESENIQAEDNDEAFDLD